MNSLEPETWSEHFDGKPLLVPILIKSGNRIMIRIVVALLASLACVTQAYYLPGIAPKNYKVDELIQLFANSLRSSVTELPYEFYHPRLHFPRDKVVYEPEGLGSVLKGDRLVSTKLEVNMLKNKTCAYVGKSELNGQDASFLADRILEQYTFNWELDGLPATSLVETAEKGKYEQIVGVLMGSIANGEKSSNALVHNHFELFVECNEFSGSSSVYQNVGDDIVSSGSASAAAGDEKSYRVVGFSVQPYSRKFGDSEKDCSRSTEAQIVQHDKAATINYYYSVKFIKSDKEWMHRWDNLLVTGRQNIHWFNIAHSLIIVIFLMAMVAMILLRALNRDISRYNNLEAQEDAQEEFGWKLVHADVFRTPSRYQALSVMIGNGAQLFVMGSVTLLFALLGFMSPANRGSLLTGMLVSYVLSGYVAGYVSARFYKMFGGESWKRNVLLTASVVPGVLFSVFIFLNFFLIGVESSAAVPFTTMLALISLWFLVSVPLCFLGAFRGFKLPAIEHPVRTNQIPRQIPEQVFYMKTVPSVLMGGILPFGAVFVELFFIMNSIWSHQFYYVFGFLFIIGCILVLTCATVAILLCYFQLCAENYKWWWRAFFTSGSSAFYVFLNAIIFYIKRSTSSYAATFFIYFGWSLVMSIMFFLGTGFIGFIACWLFVRKIYASIKID